MNKNATTHTTITRSILASLCRIIRRRIPLSGTDLADVTRCTPIDGLAIVAMQVVHRLIAAGMLADHLRDKPGVFHDPLILLCDTAVRLRPLA